MGGHKDTERDRDDEGLDSRVSSTKWEATGVGNGQLRVSATTQTTTILLIEDDERDRRMLLGSLREKYHVIVAADYSQAREKITTCDFDIVFLDLMLPRVAGEKIDESGKYGLDLLRMIREEEPLTPVVVISGLATVKTAIKVLAYGIVDFVVKDDLEDQLPIIMRRAELIRQGRVEQLILRRESPWRDSPQQLVFQSEVIRKLMAQVTEIAATDTSVLITGETGTGKELIAREIHNRSPRASSPFVPVNCGAIPGTLVESELFGHEKGAFTGAEKRKHGVIELAHNGTLFLDEIGDLPLELQVRLLRVLQERVIRRVGGEKEIAVNIRVIAATNKDLLKEVKERRFREDLYYRLAVVKLNVPPLRERLDDIKALCQHFVSKYRPGANLTWSPKAIKLLILEVWDGNIRELESVVQRVLMGVRDKKGETTVIQAGDVVRFLPEEPREAKLLVNDVEFNLMNIEQQVMRRAMEVFRNQDEAARQLGISLSQLRRKIKDYGIEYLRERKGQKRSKNAPEIKLPRPDRKAELLQLAAEHGEFTTQKAIEALGVSRKSVIEHLNELVTNGRLQKIGRGKYRELSLPSPSRLLV